MPYDIVPGVDDDHNFPPVIRAALAAAPEFEDFFNSFTESRQAYTYRWANVAARNAQTGMRVFDRGIQLDNGRDYQYYNTGWKVQHRTGVAFSIAEINSMSVSVGTETLCDNGSTYKLVYPPSAPTTPTWWEWDSPWKDFSDFGVNGIDVAKIYNRPARWRFMDGKVHYVGALNLLGGPFSGEIQIALPTNGDIASATANNAVFTNASDNYRGYMGRIIFLNNVIIAFCTPNGDRIGANTTTPFSEPWAQSDGISWNMTYDRQG